jgi:hypothetical protein
VPTSRFCLFLPPGKSTVNFTAVSGSGSATLCLRSAFL